MEIKKKFLQEIAIGFQFDEISENDVQSLKDNKNIIVSKDLGNFKLKSYKDHDSYMITSDRKMIVSFQFFEKNNNYFNCAHLNLNLIIHSRSTFLDMFSQKEVLTESLKNEIYTYFGLCSSFIIMLFTSIEAFINRMIPSDYKDVVEARDKTEIRDNQQIQRLNFDRKILILNKALNKDFKYKYKLKYTHIEKLQNFRNDIVHTKAVHANVSKYEGVHRCALKFDYVKTIEAVRDFLNFYEPGLVEEI